MSAHTPGPYLYQRSEPGLFTVGCFINGKWEPESDHTDSGEAANRVHFLNGGDDTLRAQRDELAALLSGALDSQEANGYIGVQLCEQIRATLAKVTP